MRRISCEAKKILYFGSEVYEWCHTYKSHPASLCVLIYSHTYGFLIPQYLFFLNELFAFGHHHFTKFIKVHGTRSIFIKFLKNTLNFFFCKRGKKLGDKFSQCIVGDESLTLPIIQLE